MNYRWQRAMKRVVPIAVACLSLAVLTPQVASAGFADGSDEVHRGDGDEGAYWSINPNPDTVSMYVVTNSINNNRCLDTFFDWSPVLTNHWDGRLVRNCKDNGYRDNNSFAETQGHLGDLEGARIAAGCIFYQQSNTYSPSPGAAVDCTKMGGATSNASNGNAHEWGDVLPNRYLQGWVRWANGDAEFKNGGLPWSPTS